MMSLPNNSGFELLEELGHRGMATVYRARHVLLKNPSWIKNGSRIRKEDYGSEKGIIES